MSGQESVEHRQQRRSAQRLVAELRHGRISRRDFVVRAATLGFSGAAINVFLLACSVGTSSPPTAPVAPTATIAPTAPTAGAGATTAATTPAAVAPTAAGGTASVAAPRLSGATGTATATRAGSPVAGTPTTGATGTLTAQGTLVGGEVPASATLAATQELRYPLTELVHADPGQATSLSEVLFIRNCWDGLLTANQQGEPQPAHATKYAVSADGLTYTFTLRAGLKFSDGSPLTAKDYEWTWKRNLSPDTASEYAHAFFPIKGAEDYNTGKSADPDSVGVKATADTTLVVNLVEAAPYFLALVSTWTYVPLQRATIEKNAEKWVEAGNIVTAGKYTLQAWAHDQRMVLVADSNYYGDKPTLRQITFVLYQDVTAAALPAYEKGELDVASSLSPDGLQRVKNDTTLSKELTQLPASGSGFIVFDVTNTKSSVAKQEFRQAVYYAINRENLCNNVLKGQFIPKATLVPQGILGYLEQPPLAVPLTGDQAKAQQLLQAAGYNGQEIVYTHSDATTNATIARAIQADLQGVGINIRLDQLERKAYAAWRETRQDQAFEMYTGAWFSDYEDPHDWYNVFFGNPNQEFWHTHYPQLASSAPFLDLIGKADALPDRAQRRAGFEQAEKQLLTDLPLVPLYGNVDVVMVKPYVKGLIHTRLSQDLFGGIAILKH